MDQDVGRHEDMTIGVTAETTEVMAGTTDEVAATTVIVTPHPHHLVTMIEVQVDTTIDQDMTIDHGTIDILETTGTTIDLREMTDHRDTNHRPMFYAHTWGIRELLCALLMLRL